MQEYLHKEDQHNNGKNRAQDFRIIFALYSSILLFLQVLRWLFLFFFQSISHGEHLAYIKAYSLCYFSIQFLSINQISVFQIYFVFFEATRIFLFLNRYSLLLSFLYSFQSFVSNSLSNSSSVQHQRKLHLLTDILLTNEKI